MKFINIIILALIISFANIYAYSTDNADAEYKFIKHEYVLNTDGSYTYNYSHQIKLLTGYAVNRAYGETFIIYNPNGQELKVNKSVTTMADGKKVSSPPNAYNESLPFSAAHATPYMQLREMVVTHTGLEKNCEIELDYSIKSKAGFSSVMADKIIAGGRSPIKKMEIIVKVPAGKKLNYFMLNSDKKAAMSKEGSFDVYTWEFDNISLVAVENNQPALDEFLPVLYFSSEPDSKLLGSLFPNDEKYSFLDDDAVKVINEITKDKFGDFDKSMAIRDYIHDNVGNAHIGMQYLGYKPLPVNRVFHSSVGTPIDRINLFRAMCSKSGIKYNYLTYNSEDEGIDFLKPILDDADFFIGSRENVFDPNSNSAYQIVNGPGCFLNDFTKTNNREYPAENKITFSANLSIQDNKCEGSGKIFFSGDYAKDRTAGNYDDDIKSMLSYFGYETEISEPDFFTERNTCQRNLTLKSELENTAGLMVLKVPHSPLGIEDMSLHLPSNAARVTPLKLDKTVNEEYIFRIELPEAMKLAIEKEAVEFKTSFGSVHTSFNQDGNILTVKRQIKIDKRIIPAESYKELQKLAAIWKAPAFRTIYLCDTSS